MDKNDTICRTCLRLREGLCDGEKGQTACAWYKRMTNGDRVRAMTDEELAKWIVKRTEGWGMPECDLYVQSWLDWLKQEVTDGSPKD